jgi:hypothetical protein
MHVAGQNSRQFDAVARWLWDGPWYGLPCYHCGHHIIRGLGTVQHLIPPSVAPALAADPRNLRPCHAGGNRRCPECGLACQQVAAGNLAPRDEQGRPLPFPPEFIKAKQASRAKWLAQRGLAQGPVAETPPLRRVYSDAGRPW